jgi:hypothetical protein
VRDPEPACRVPVPVREEPDLAEVERLAPRRLRPGRVARDRERLDTRLVELRSPVTQELELVRSGRRPGEEEEKEERGPLRHEAAGRHGLARGEPDGCVRYGVSESEHGTTLVPTRGLRSGDLRRAGAKIPAMNPLRKLMSWWRGPTDPESVAATAEAQHLAFNRDSIRASQSTAGRVSGGPSNLIPTPDEIDPGKKDSAD